MVRPVGSNKHGDGPQRPKEVSRRLIASAELTGQAVRNHFFNPHAVGFRSLEGRVSKEPPSSDDSGKLFNKAAGKKRRKH